MDGCDKEQFSWQGIEKNGHGNLQYQQQHDLVKEHIHATHHSHHDLHNGKKKNITTLQS